jgi:hypothetical protein
MIIFLIVFLGPTDELRSNFAIDDFGWDDVFKKKWAGNQA